MSIRFVLLPVFVLVGLTFAMLLGAARSRSRDGETTRLKDSAPGDQNWPTLAAPLGDPFGLSLLFYILIALALPLRHADLVIVLLSWVFVVTQFAHAGIFVTSNNAQQRGMIWFAGVLVLFAMWLYFALKMLLLI
jgi:hypothetical protein